MIPEAPFFFSIAALSVTLAGFAGLVAAFRRGAEWRAMDVFRLREIAEFGLGNALIALLAVPLGATLGDFAAAFRVCAIVAGVFVVGGGVVVIRRGARLNVRGDRTWYAFAGIVDVGAIAAAIATAAAPSVALYEWMLVFLLARPMLVFVLVLGSLRHEA